MSQACIESSAGANCVHAKLDRHITRASIAHMQDSSSFDAADGMPRSDVKSLLAMFKESTEISYTVLWDAPLPSNGSNDNSTPSLIYGNAQSDPTIIRRIS